jgi:hypothetical protein
MISSTWQLLTSIKKNDFINIIAELDFSWQFGIGFVTTNTKANRNQPYCQMHHMD